MISKKKHSLVAGFKILLPISTAFVSLLLFSFTCKGNTETPSLRPTDKQIARYALSVIIQKGDSVIKKRDTVIEKGVGEELPQYPGGLKAMSQFLSAHMRYPAIAQETNTQGTVYVQFLVKSDGQLTNFKVLKGIGMGCDQEAVRVVKLMPNWIPGLKNGEAADVLFQIPINFRMRPVQIK